MPDSKPTVIILTIASKDVEELLSQGHFYALGPIHYARKVVNHFQ
jgi:hypothetical protein